MSSDAAVSPPSKDSSPILWCNVENSSGCREACSVLGNAVVGCEVRDLRGRQWTLKDEQGTSLMHSSIHFNCHKVVILLTFTPV